MKKYRVDIRESYRDFYRKFALVVHGNGIIRPLNLEFKKTSNPVNGKIALQLQEPIFLSNWPITKKVPHPTVDISVHAAFWYKTNDLLHTRSSVYLTYYKRDTVKMVAEPFANLRFDYHPDTDDGAHPLLHAHVFSNDIPELMPLFPKGYKIEWDTIKRYMGSLRVPVPNMTLPSVLLCLVACHLGAGKAKELLSKTEDQRQEFPHLDLSQGQLELLGKHSFAGSQWFERA